MFIKYIVRASAHVLHIMILALPAMGQEKAPPVADTEIEAVVKGNNEFALQMYREFAKNSRPDQTIFFSPYSISASMAMLYAGARGETAEEMSRVLHFARKQPTFHAAFGELASRLQHTSNDTKRDFHMANGIWIDRSLTLSDPFTRVLDSHYASSLHMSDFRLSDLTRKEINNWIAVQTNKTILDLLPEGAVDRSTRLIIASAMHFNADWLYKFRKDDTRDGAFYASPGIQARILMMHQTTHLRYARLNDCTILELPYQGGRFCMFILLPDSNSKLESAARLITEAHIWNKQLAVHEVTLALPKFAVRQQREVSSVLAQMGMPTAFKRLADFSGAAAGLQINNVYHQANVEINEGGTSASAATAILLRGSKTPTATVICDRPFFIAIQESSSRNTMFLGRISFSNANVKDRPQPKHK